MTFGAASTELMPGAHNAIDVCLAIRPGERVVLAADDASRPVAASLALALDAAAAETDPLLIEALTARPMTTAPTELLAALERADAAILCVQPQQGELGARMAVVAAVERRRLALHS